MDVAVRELKARLSAYLRQAAAGQHITVTDRGRAVAVLGPVLETVDLAGAVEAGWVTAATGPRLTPLEPVVSNGTVAGALAEDRGV